MSNADKTQAKLLNSIRKTKEGVAAKAKDGGVSASDQNQSAQTKPAATKPAPTKAKKSSQASNRAASSGRATSGSFPDRCRVWPD